MIDGPMDSRSPGGIKMLETKKVDRVRFAWLVVCLFALGFVGCGLSPTTTTSTTQTTTTESTAPTTTRYSILHQTPILGDYNDIEVVDVAGNADGFTYTVDAITYHAVTNKVTFRFTLSDPDDEAAYGVRIAPKTGSGSSTVGVFVPNASPTQSFTFDLFSSSNWYVITIEKVHRHNVTNELVSEESFRRIELRLISFDLVHKVDTVRLSFKEYEFGETTFSSDPEGHTYQEVSLTFIDPNVGVTHVTVAFIEQRTGRVCSERSVTISRYRDASGKATLSNFRLDYLIPGVKYTVVAYASGNNGISDYHKVELARSEFTAREYGGTSNFQSHALNAYMTHHGLSTEGFLVNVHLFNDETVLNPDTNAPYAFALRLLSKDDEVLWERPLNNSTEEDVLIPIELLKIDSRLAIQETSGLFDLTANMIPFRKPTCTGDLWNVGETRYFKLYCSEMDGDITGGTIDIYAGDTFIITIPFDEQMTQEYVTITLPAFSAAGQWVTARGNLTYTAFDGNEEGLIEFSIR
jgi:hypothetical protein